MLLIFYYLTCTKVNDTNTSLGGAQDDYNNLECSVDSHDRDSVRS